MDGMSSFESETGMEYLIPFRSNPQLQQTYTHFPDMIRFDRIMAELDRVAGMTSLHYIKESGQDVTCVTASLDQFDVVHSISPANNVWLRASVNAVFNKSMEVGVKLITVVDNGECHVATGYFTMVGIGTDGKTAVLPSFEPMTKKEKRRALEARVRRDASKEERSRQMVVIPTPGEIQAVRDLSNQHAWRLPFIRETRHPSEIEMYHEYTNHLGNVFGGRLMQFAYQNAYIAAQTHCEAYPLLAGVDRIDFVAPVHIGDIILVESKVVHVGNTSMSIETVVSSRDQGGSEQRLTNNCYFTFVATDKDRNKIPCPKVVPGAKEESDAFILGMRRYQATRERCGFTLHYES